MERSERIRRLLAALVPWYAEAARPLPWRADPEPYHVWISEIMLQQTRIETVIPYYHRFLRELPDVAALAAAEPAFLEKLWEGLGYYSRVRNLQKAAVQIMTEYGGRFPERYEDIRRLCGIGDYTAGAISSICFDLPEPAVDGNVLRVLSRVTTDPRPVTDEKLKKEVREELRAAYPEHSRGACTQAIMELGETVCLPGGAPDCTHCPCREFCLSAEGDWMLYPVKGEKKARRVEKLTVFILHSDGRTAIRRRPENGLLSGLWELPNVPGNLSAEEAESLVRSWGCGPQSVCEGKPCRHIFTHIEWEMRCYTVECAGAPSDFDWPDAVSLDLTVSLPTAFRKVLNAAREEE